MVQSVSGQDDLLGLECLAFTGMALQLLLLLLAARLWVPFPGFVQRCGLGARGRSHRTPWKLSRARLRWSRGGAAGLQLPGRIVSNKADTLLTVFF